MNEKQDIIDFERWATDLGCPIENFPTKKSLERIFSSNQSLCFLDLMKIVRTKVEINDLRQRIIVNSIKDVNDKMLTNQIMQKLPEKLQRWFKIDKLKKEKSRNAENLIENVNKYKRIIQNVKENNITKLKLKQCCNDEISKIAVLKTKSFEWLGKIELETNENKSISNILPKDIDSINFNDIAASEAIQMAKEYLSKFYALKSDRFEQASNTDSIDVLWINLQKVFSEISNYILWNKLFNERKMQVQDMEIMSKKNIDKILYVQKGSMTALKIAVNKMYAKHICIEANRRGQTQKKQLLDNDYVLMYNVVVEHLRAKYLLYNNQNIEDQLIDEYMHEYCLYCYSKAEVLFLRSSLNSIAAEIETYNSICNNHEIIIRTLKSIYKEIEDLYCNTRINSISMLHVKEKLIKSEKTLQYLVQTKSIDLNCSTINSLNVSFRSNRNSDSEFSTNTPLTQLSNELKLFVQVPISKMKQQFIFELLIDFMPNLLMNEIINRKTFHLETIRCTIGAAQQMINENKELQLLFEETTSNETIPTVNFDHFNEQKYNQTNSIAQLNDNTLKINMRTLHWLDTVQKYVKFKWQNPLKKYIPLSKSFNGHNYYDYEREFLMYYNMITNSTSY